MDKLFEKSLRTLELPRVLEKLAAQATSEEAKAKARALLPQTDAEDVRRLQQETSAACMLLGLQGSPSFAGVKDVSAALVRAQRGGMLNTRCLLYTSRTRCLRWCCCGWCFPGRRLPSGLIQKLSLIHIYVPRSHGHTA